jgi:putative NADH-flavin reductase
MKIAVFGGTGGTGRKIIEQALELGMEVRALLRTPGKLTIRDKKLEVIEGSALDGPAVSETIRGTQAVLSALGTRSLGKTTIYSDSIARIIQAMADHQVTRILCVGAVGMDPGRNTDMPVVEKLLVKLLLTHTLRDMYAMQLKLEATDLSWTMMWPPRLNDGPLIGTYRVVANQALKKGRVISRADLAHFIVRNIDNTEYFQSRVAIAY